MLLEGGREGGLPWHGNRAELGKLELKKKRRGLPNSKTLSRYPGGS
jgi:hypothetical protein